MAEPQAPGAFHKFPREALRAQGSARLTTEYVGSGIGGVQTLRCRGSKRYEATFQKLLSVSQL